MDQAIERDLTPPTQTQSWCVMCGHPRPDARFCTNCNSDEEDEVTMERDWRYYPMLILLKYYKWGIPGTIMSLGFALYGIMELIEWLVL